MQDLFDQITLATYVLMPRSRIGMGGGGNMMVAGYKCPVVAQILATLISLLIPGYLIRQYTYIGIMNETISIPVAVVVFMLAALLGFAVIPYTLFRIFLAVGIIKKQPLSIPKR
jgi:hypothetical protein